VPPAGAVVVGAAPVVGATTLIAAEVIGIAAVTVKLTSKLLGGMLLLLPAAGDTVTVAVYVPAASPFLGTIGKVALSEAAILLIDVVDTVVDGDVDSVKLPAFAPPSVAVNAPVGWLPVLLTVTLNAVGAVVYP